MRFFSGWALILAVPALAAGGLGVEDAWIRSMPQGIPSAGYFTLHNGTAKDMVLTGASTPACAKLTLHRSENVGGMSTMRPVEDLNIPAGASVTFAPGAYHLMCMEATPAIKPGARIPVTLIFKDGSKLTAPFDVRNAAGH